MPLLSSIFSRTDTNRSQISSSEVTLVLNEGIQWADSSLTRQTAFEPTFHGRLVDGGLRREEAERGSCGNALCSSGWVAPWKDRQRPFFEGKWACSSRCLSAMVRSAIAREAGDGRHDGAAVQHRHRVPLGLILLAQGWITHPQLQKALESQKANGSGRIGDWLVSECGVETECVTRGLSVQWSCPVLTTDGFSPQAMALAVPKPFVEEYGILPLRIAGTRTLYLGFQDHLDAMSAFAVEQMNGIKTESGVVPESRYLDARKRLLESDFAELSEHTLPDVERLAVSVAELIEYEQPVASRLVRMHQYYWLRTWSQIESRRPGHNAPVSPNRPHDFVFTIGNIN